MIRTETLSTRRAPPTAPTAPPPQLRAVDPLHGPARDRDPVAAMARDIAEIAATVGGVDEAALRQRGWSVAEIVEHLPDAIARTHGAEAVGP